MSGPRTTRPRTVGRVREIALRAERPTGDVAIGDLGDLTWTTEPISTGSVQILLLGPDGSTVGRYRVSGPTHDDLHFGRYSAPDGRYAYGSQLEVSPDQRSRGLGEALVRIGRNVAGDQWGFGLKTLIGHRNEPSLRCNRSAGLTEHLAINGVRLGGRVWWLHKRTISG